MAYDFLEAHALSNVWCAPYQDKQSITRLARLTPKGGAFNYFKVQNDTQYFPVKGVRFYVYQIGQIDPLLMGLYPKHYRWNTFAEACNKENLIVDIYANSGIQMPRTQCWYKITSNHNLIVAIQAQTRIPINLDTENIFLRVYSNSFYRSEAATDVSAKVYVEGTTPLDTDAILQLQNDLAAYQSMPGQVYSFVNGFKVSGIDLFTVNVGDIVEFVYDASIYKVVDFTIGELSTFDSLLDLKTKYLLHYPGNVNEIDYEDDIDAFICEPQPGGRFQGVYYHRNAKDAMRMVTHKDYAVVVPYIMAFCQDQGWADPTTCILRLHIRNGGWGRALVNENNRIEELYKLDDSDLQGAMLGINSTVPYWRADTLENSAYTQIMGSLVPILDKATVQTAYGYNAISKLIGDTPEFVSIESDQKIVSLPYGLQTKSTGYEYDVNGFLLGWASHQLGSIYPAANSAAELVEVISGTANDQLDEVYGAATTTLDATADYRMYTCPIVAGIPTNVWTDVTGTAQYSILNGVLTWLIDTTAFYTLVRGNRLFLGYSLDLTMTDGLLNFSLAHRAQRNNLISTWIMQIPMGELDLWLNGKALVEGVDYYVNFPQIEIVNKNYLTADPTQGTQHVDIRFTGFCNADFTRTPQDDKGFIQYGMLSENNKFDIRDDKVLRIQVDGAVYDRSELLFSETDAAVTVPEAIDGKPYLVRDIVVPLRGLTTIDTYTMRAGSIVIDNVVSAYLTEKIPMPQQPDPPVIEALYPVISPFCCKLIYDMNANILDDPRMYQQYADSVVFELCAPYEYLLKVDPTQPGLTPDQRFVIILPHNLNTVIGISIYHYQFLVRAVKLYLNGLVNLASFLQIETYTGGS